MAFCGQIGERQLLRRRVVRLLVRGSVVDGVEREELHYALLHLMAIKMDGQGEMLGQSGPRVTGGARRTLRRLQCRPPQSALGQQRHSH